MFDQDEPTTIIAADFMYLIIIGNQHIITKITNHINTHITNYNNHKLCIQINIDTPCSNTLDKKQLSNIIDNNSDFNFEFSNSKYAIIEEGVETAQCLTFADFSNNVCNISKYQIIMFINDHNSHFSLSFPILNLDEEVNPDDLITKWFKDNNLSNIINHMNIKPINIVGNQHDILVFSVYVY